MKLLWLFSNYLLNKESSNYIQIKEANESETPWIQILLRGFDQSCQTLSSFSKLQIQLWYFIGYELSIFTSSFPSPFLKAANRLRWSGKAPECLMSQNPGIHSSHPTWSKGSAGKLTISSSVSSMEAEDASNALPQVKQDKTAFNLKTVHEFTFYLYSTFL